MFRRTDYTPHRRLVYLILWTIAVAELGVTGYRIHHTKSNFSFYDPIVAELLVTSILTLIWAPLTLLFHRSGTNCARVGTSGIYGGLHYESSGNLVLWLMWFIGAAIAAHDWPNKLYAGSGKQGHILLTIVALAFIEFGLMTLAKVAALMEYAALGATGGTVLVATEKPSRV